ncbi:MAG: hypothetical protein H6R23_155 [Proteobacteria bacterium]|nr:hypothetical protein [Pseudomonadota bacterium]
MHSVLQQIALQFEHSDPDKARELRRIHSAYIAFGLNDSAVAASDESAARLLRYLPRMARMKNFRLYRIGVGEQANGAYAHQAVALLETRHLPTPGNTAGIGNVENPVRDDDTHQYPFEVWQALQHQYGHGCALLPNSRQP